MVCYNKNFNLLRVFLALDRGGPWNLVLDKELEDPRQQNDPLPLQIINLDYSGVSRFLKFELVSNYGADGGLMYFSTYKPVYSNN